MRNKLFDTLITTNRDRMRVDEISLQNICLSKKFRVRKCGSKVVSLSYTKTHKKNVYQNKH